MSYLIFLFVVFCLIFSCSMLYLIFLFPTSRGHEVHSSVSDYQRPLQWSDDVHFLKKIKIKMLCQYPHVMIRSESSVADLRGLSHDSFLDNLIFFNFMQILGKIWYWRFLSSLKASNPPFLPQWEINIRYGELA